jgi:hypothetical protein
MSVRRSLRSISDGETSPRATRRLARCAGDSGSCTAAEQSGGCAFPHVAQEVWRCRSGLYAGAVSSYFDAGLSAVKARRILRF